MSRLPTPYCARLSTLGAASYDAQAACYAELAYSCITGSSSSSRSLPASASAHFLKSRRYGTLTKQSTDNVRAPDFPARCAATRAQASPSSDTESSTTAQVRIPDSCCLSFSHSSRSPTSGLVDRSYIVHRPSPSAHSLPRRYSAGPIPESLLALQHQRSDPSHVNLRPRSGSLRHDSCPCSSTPSCSDRAHDSLPTWLPRSRRQHSSTNLAPSTTFPSPSTPTTTAWITVGKAHATGAWASLATTPTPATISTWQLASHSVGPGPASQAPLVPGWWAVAAARPSAVRCLHNGHSGPFSAAGASGGVGACGSGGDGLGGDVGGGSRRQAAAGGSPRRLGGGGGASLPPRDQGLGAPMEVFDRPLKSLHRDRSATLLDASDPLLTAVADRLLDRLEDCRRGFGTAVVLGGAAVPVVRQLAGGRAGIQRLIVVDSSQAMLDRIRHEAAVAQSTPGAKPWPQLLCVLGDEETLPLRSGSVDLIVSCLGLHWVNDLPGAMAQCRAALAPDGLFLAALLGGETLQELRIACALAQMEREGGVSVVVSPLAQVRDAGNLLTRADLRLPSVDVDRFTLGYPSALELVHHLRALGESNAAHQRRRRLSRDSALAAAAVYQYMFGSEAPSDGGDGQDGSGGGDATRGVTATYEVIFMTGWGPSPHQPKAAKRGSATVSFQDLADGLVNSGGGVGGTAEGQLLTEGPPGGAAAGTTKQ